MTTNGNVVMTFFMTGCLTVASGRLANEFLSGNVFFHPSTQADGRAAPDGTVRTLAEP
jgi:hypothetical protein